MFLERPRLDFSSGAVGGETAGLGEIFTATQEQFRFAENSSSRGIAMIQAYEHFLSPLREATGEHIPNPLREDRPSRPGADARRMAEEAEFFEQLKGLAKRHPDAADRLFTPEDVRRHAEGLARQAEGRFNRVMARSPVNVLSTVAFIAGGFAGSLEDPMNFAASLVVGPFGPAGAGVRGLLWAGLKAGAANAAVETAIQPSVQAWRAQAGLPSGFDIAALNVGAAALFGAGLDIGVRSSVRGVRQLVGKPYLGPEGQPRDPGANPTEALEAAARDAPEGSLLKRAQQGDADALRELAETTGADQRPEVRAALEKLDFEKLAAGIKPDGVPSSEHLTRMAEGVEALVADSAPPGSATVPARTARGAALPDLSNDAPAPKVDSSTTIEGKPVAFRELNPQEIEADPEIFQFKSGGDAFGVTERLRGVKRWDPLRSSKAVVFERADGRMVIADGHQRLGLAKRLMADPRTQGPEPRLDAFVFREADGWRAEDVSAYAALKNMGELSGSSVDMAKVMRARPDLIDDSLPLSDARLKQAVALSKLERSAFDMVVGGVAPANYAALIGDRVPDPARHAGLLRDLMESGAQTEQQARLTLGQLLAVPTKTETQETLFGLEAFTRTLMPERVRVLDSALKALKNDKRVFGVLQREAARIEGEGNVLARQQNATQAERAAQLAELVEALSTRTGPVADLLNEAAKAVGGGIRTGTAAKGFIARITDIMERDGVAGLSEGRPVAREAIDDPQGPEAQAQTDRLDPMFSLRGVHSTARDFDTFDPDFFGRADAGYWGRGVYMFPRAYAQRFGSASSWGIAYGSPDRAGMRNLLLRVDAKRPFFIDTDRKPLTEKLPAEWRSLKEHGWPYEAPPVAVWLRPEQFGVDLENLRDPGFDAIAERARAEARELGSRINDLEQRAIRLLNTFPDEFVSLLDASDLLARIETAPAQNRAALRQIYEEWAPLDAMANQAEQRAVNAEENATPQARLASQFTDALLLAGYDAVVMRNNGEAYEIAAIKPGTVRGELTNDVMFSLPDNVVPIRPGARIGGSALPRLRSPKRNVKEFIDERVENIRGSLSDALSAVSVDRAYRAYQQWVVATRGKQPVSRTEFVSLMRENGAGVGVMAGKERLALGLKMTDAERAQADLEAGKQAEINRAFQDLRRLENEKADLGEELDGLADARDFTGRRRAQVVNQRLDEIEQEIADVQSRRAGLEAELEAIKNQNFRLVPIEGGDDPMFAITAFHGSPHRFDRFDISKIGAGEGNQAFGFGLYFAQNPKVAVEYRNSLSPEFVDGRSFDSNNPRHLVASALEDRGSKDDAIAMFEGMRQLAEQNDRADRFDLAEQSLEILRGTPEGDLPRITRGGHIYEVRIDTEEKDLLDWDEMIGEFPAMLEKLLPLAQRINPDFNENRLRRYLRGRTGNVFYADLTVALGGWPPNAAEALREAGIPGIIYYDGDSRALGQGTRNIVTFSDDIVEIVRRDGKPLSRSERDEVMASLTSRPISFRPGTAAAPTAGLQAAMPEIRAEVDKIISRTLPPEVKAVVRDRLTFSDLPERLRPAGMPDRQFNGLADPYERVVYVSLNALDPAAATRHESVHMLRAMGLIPEDDWARLVAEAERLGLRAEFGIDATYRELYGQRYRGDGARLEAALTEETIAEMVAQRGSGRNFGSAFNRIMDRVIKFLRSVRDMLGVRGFRTVQDVLEDIEAGTFARRETADAIAEADNLARAGDAMFQLGGPDPNGTRARIQKVLRDNNAGEEFTRDILDQFDRLVRDFEDEARAQTETAARLREAANQQKRQELLQQKAISEIFRVMLSFRDARGQPDPAFAARALLEHHGDVVMPQGMISLDGHRKAVLAQLITDMDEAFHRLRPKLSSGRPRDDALQERIVDELWGVDTGDPDAKAIAQAWAEAVEKARQRFNAAGGNIPKREDWRAPQPLEAEKLLGVGEEGFVRRTLERLDLEQMRHPLSGNPMTRSDAEAMLRWIYEEIVTDGWAHREPKAQQMGLGKIANRRGDHRVLVYKDAASYRAQMDEFGRGDNHFERMVAHLEGIAKDIAAMEVMGPNPEASLQWMSQLVTQQASVKAGGGEAIWPTTRPALAINKDPMSYANATTKRMRDMWTVYRGGLGVPESARLAGGLATGRNVVTASLLGHAQISALGDIGLQMQARKFAGLPQAKAIPGIVANLKTDKREIQRAGIMVENYLNRIDAGGRSKIAVQGTKWSQVMADRVITFSGLKTWTEAQQRSFQQAVMGAFADSADRGFDALNADARKLLRRYGMDAGDWERLRASIPAQDDGSPGLWLRPADVARAEELAGRGGERLAERYAAMLMQEAQFTSPTSTLRSRALMTQGQRAGSLGGEAMRWLTQFKSFAIMMHQLWMERIAREFYAGNTGRAAGMAAAAGAKVAIPFFITMTLTGALALQLKEIANGRDPRDMTDAKFWGAAMLQAGGLGILGDFLFSDQNRFGMGSALTLAGPLTDLAGDTLGLVQAPAANLLLGEDHNLGRKGVDFLRRWTPGAGIWYYSLAVDRLIFDELQRLADPDAHKSFRSKMRFRRENFGNDFFWRPGRRVPDRAPSLDAALGGR